MNSEIENLVISNAKAIAALTTALNQEKEERKKADLQWEKDRHKLYQYLGRIASAQSHFYEVQSDYYEQLSILSEKQTKFEEKQLEIQEKQTKLQEKQTRFEEKQTKLEEKQLEIQGEIVELLKYLSSDTTNN